MALTRRAFLAALLVLLLALNAAAADRPILFVHGNGETAALWHTAIWRFESNGYDPALLFAIDFKHPRARSDDTKPQDNRSSIADQLKELSAKISEIQSRTGQKQLALVGSSRGGYPIRNYIKNLPAARPMFPTLSCVERRITAFMRVLRTSILSSMEWELSFPASIRATRFTREYNS